MFNVNANLYRAVAGFASTEKTRYYLNGVYIEPGPGGVGAILTATDGHAMLTAYDELGFCDKAEIVRLDNGGLKATKQGKRETDPRRIALQDDGTVLVQTGGGANLFICNDWHIDGTFPDWRRVMPTAEFTIAGAAGWYDQALIARFGVAWREAAPECARGISIRAKDAGSPALVVFVGIPEMVGTLMPMRGDEKDWKLPEWVGKPTIKED